MFVILFNLRSAMDELMLPEFVDWVLDEFNEGDQ